MSSQPPLTPAEKAAAEHLARLINDDDQNPALNMLGKLGHDVDRAEPGWFAREARAVVAAVGPLMAIKFYENLADLTEKQGPMSAAGFRALALLTRQSLSRPILRGDRAMSTSSPSTTDRLVAIRARRNAATPGHWVASGQGTHDDDCVVTTGEDFDALAVCPDCGTRGGMAAANALFVSHAPGDIDHLLSLVDSLQERLDTAEGRLRELASKQDRIPDTDNGDWGIGWDDGYNAALAEVRHLAAEVLPETIAERHCPQEFPRGRVICVECSGQPVPWDFDETALVLWPCADAKALGLDGGNDRV